MVGGGFEGFALESLKYAVEKGQVPRVSQEQKAKTSRTTGCRPGETRAQTEGKKVSSRIERALDTV